MIPNPHTLRYPRFRDLHIGIRDCNHTRRIPEPYGICVSQRARTHNDTNKFFIRREVLADELGNFETSSILYSSSSRAADSLLTIARYSPSLLFCW